MSAEVRKVETARTVLLSVHLTGLLLEKVAEGTTLTGELLEALVAEATASAYKSVDALIDEACAEVFDTFSDRDEALAMIAEIKAAFASPAAESAGNPD